MSPWTRLRISKITTAVAMLGGVLAIWEGSMWARVLGIGFVLVAAYSWHNFRCPNCSLRFFTGGNGKVLNPFSTSCMHCGQRVGHEPKAAA